jgi:hypothetical protein
LATYDSSIGSGLPAVFTNLMLISGRSYGGDSALELMFNGPVNIGFTDRYGPVGPHEWTNLRFSKA